MTPIQAAREYEKLMGYCIGSEQDKAEIRKFMQGSQKKFKEWLKDESWNNTEVKE